ncbi:polyhydroxyalkanoate synthesis repressor PhaR [Limoniibacter endophyticus]|uniref:Polyhydroxyalkanoate synthesis repressor PhaR n=1 Tax=Limoniibacter endophyticus TaxID=1565040 RepID=A0A8J3GIB2_9HYPH|nr:polyhydroxyalkanoate synthesis repressor PhaR [Limoniibacter endophyticus]GHC77181.1 polyhydroxyalkanoate synthesis repressor PhaR [Limoniibacter endophyticus]
MSVKTGPVVIKKYANRRLYNTGTSTYITLDDLAVMIRRGEEFSVQDAKTGDDLTHSVLTQIIFELENKQGENLLPNQFLRQLIAFYGDQMQTIVPDFLERSMSAFAQERDRIRKEAGSEKKASYSANEFAASMKMFEEQALRSLELWQQTWSAFSNVGARANSDVPCDDAPANGNDAEATSSSSGKKEELELLREQLAAMQKRLDALDG